MLILLTLINCRSKKKLIEKSNETKTEFSKINSFTETKVKDSVLEKKQVKKEINKNINQNDGDIIIKGNSKPNEDFEFHNVIDGDTISSVKIQGNATFEIKNKWKKEETKISEKSSFENLNIIAKAARTAVAKETIKKVATESKKVTNEVKANGFQAPIYIVFGVIALVSTVLFIIIRSIKKRS